MEMFAQNGLWSGRFLFLRKELKWSSLEYSYYTSYLGAIGLLSQYIIVPVMANKLKLHDSTISLLGTILEMYYNVILHENVFYR